MQVLINGVTMTVPTDTNTVVQLLEHLKLNKELAIVEVNQVILQPEERDNTPIKEQDKIEIVQFVGGG